MNGKHNEMECFFLWPGDRGLRLKSLINLSREYFCKVNYINREIGKILGLNNSPFSIQLDWALSGWWSSSVNGEKCSLTIKKLGGYLMSTRINIKWLIKFISCPINLFSIQLATSLNVVDVLVCVFWRKGRGWNAWCAMNIFACVFVCVGFDFCFLLKIVCCFCGHCPRSSMNGSKKVNRPNESNWKFISFVYQALSSSISILRFVRCHLHL